MILHGDCLEHLVQMPDQHVQTCVTSPPYWGLRDYGTAKWDGGAGGCDHKPDVVPRTQRARSGLTGGLDYMAAKDPVYRDTCKKCGAVRIDGQLGLEPTPDAYVANLVRVFREVRRVLKDDGTLWLNLGDSYARNGGQPDGGNRDLMHMSGTQKRMLKVPAGTGLKHKDLVGIPWRVAFALQADGWYLRQDIIWHKPNPMPESVRDRCTKAHEYIFLLSKQAKYYFDCDAIKEPFTDNRMGNPGKYKGVTGSGWNADGKATGRNKRSVWTVMTKPFKGAHFATFPRDLIEPCILAGSAFGDYVLDPFAGAGTVGVVCKNHGRKFIGIELNSEYAAMAEHRIEACI